MSESRRKINVSDEWFRIRVAKLCGDQKYQFRLKAITTEQTGAWAGRDCTRELTVLACSAVSPHQGRPATLERTWASKTGKTWKALRVFPERLREMADEVERINAGDPMFFARTRHWNVDRYESGKLRDACEQLPELMRSYAKALTDCNEFRVRVTPVSGRLKALLALSELVKYFTGAYRDKQVSELLNTAANVFEERVQFDALRIAQARSRDRKKHSET